MVTSLKILEVLNDLEIELVSIVLVATYIFCINMLLFTFSFDILLCTDANKDYPVFSSVICLAVKC